MTVVEREVVEVEAPVTDVERRARVLEAAALEIEVRGWVRTMLENRGGVCAVGGIAYALGCDHPSVVDYEGKTLSVFDAAGRVWGIDNEQQIWRFNDKVGRTASEVTFLLRWRAQELRDGWDAA